MRRIHDQHLEFWIGPCPTNSLTPRSERTTHRLYFNVVDTYRQEKKHHLSPTEARSACEHTPMHATCLLGWDGGMACAADCGRISSRISPTGRSSTRLWGSSSTERRDCIHVSKSEMRNIELFRLFSDGLVFIQILIFPPLYLQWAGHS